MRVENDRSRYEYRRKRRNYRRNDEHHFRNNGNYSSRNSLKPHHDYQSNSSRYDRQMNNHDIYPTLSNDQPVIPSVPPAPPTGLYYNSTQPIRERSEVSSSYYNRYSSYRRDNSPYRNDSYEYRSPTLNDSYNDMYRTSDYSNRSERYDIGSNRNNYSMTSPIYRSDSYRTSSVIPMSSSSSPPSLSTSRDQYVQTHSPTIREIDYRTRDYGMTVPMDHRQINSDRYFDDYYSTSSHRDRTNLKHSRSNFNENEFKRSMRR